MRLFFYVWIEYPGGEIGEGVAKNGTAYQHEQIIVVIAGKVDDEYGRHKLDDRNHDVDVGSDVVAVVGVEDGSTVCEEEISDNGVCQEQ